MVQDEVDEVDLTHEVLNDELGEHDDDVSL